MNVAPILPGFFPDPSICRWGDRYVLVTSTFEYLPGVTVHVSEDLVTWEHVGHAIAGRAQLDLLDAPASAGVYAATVRSHGGRLYVVTTDIGSADRGHLVVSADDPRGPWSDPVRITGVDGIDPDLFWDDDGTCHLSWTGGAQGVAGRGILSVPVDPDTGALCGRVRRLWQGSGLAHPEGPHLYRIGDVYYCLLAEGGTERGHAVTLARAPGLDGPWEPCPTNPVLTHRSTTHPVQNVGHADLVPTPDGRWAMVHLGVRARGTGPGFHVNGRESFVVGVDWVDGWPVVDEDRFRPAPLTSFDDAFTGPALDVRWCSPGGLHEQAVALLPGGGLRVRPVTSRFPQRPVLCVRARDLAWRAEVAFTGDLALVVRLDDDAAAEVRVEAGAVTAEVGAAGVHHELARVEGVGEVTGLWVEAVPAPGASSGRGPDELVLGVVGAGGAVEMARVDGRWVSTEVAGGFTGRMIGVRAVGGEAQVTRFAYRGG